MDLNFLEHQNSLNIAHFKSLFEPTVSNINNIQQNDFTIYPHFKSPFKQIFLLNHDTVIQKISLNDIENIEQIELKYENETIEIIDKDMYKILQYLYNMHDCIPFHTLYEKNLNLFNLEKGHIKVILTFTEENEEENNLQIQSITTNYKHLSESFNQCIPLLQANKTQLKFTQGNSIDLHQYVNGDVYFLIIKSLNLNETYNLKIWNETIPLQADAIINGYLIFKFTDTLCYDSYYKYGIQSDILHNLELHIDFVDEDVEYDITFYTLRLNLFVKKDNEACIAYA